MKRSILLMFALFIFCSCNKENDFSTQVSLEQTTTELKYAHGNLLNAINGLKDLQMEQLQRLATSSNPLEDLKAMSSDGYSQVEKNYTQFVRKANEMKKFGVSIAEIKTILADQTTQYFQVHENSNNAFDGGLPCYDVWEVTVAGILGSYAVCVGATGWSGVGLAGCSIGLGMGMLIAEKEYEICLNSTYQ